MFKMLRNGSRDLSSFFFKCLFQFLHTYWKEQVLCWIKYITFSMLQLRFPSIFQLKIVFAVLLIKWAILISLQKQQRLFWHFGLHIVFRYIQGEILGCLNKLVRLCGLWKATSGGWGKIFFKLSLWVWDISVSFKNMIYIQRLGLVGYNKLSLIFIILEYFIKCICSTSWSIFVNYIIY